jgi:hypothetical protein
MAARRATRQGLQDDDERRFEHDNQRRSANPATRRVETTTAQRRGCQRIPPDVDELGPKSKCTPYRRRMPSNVKVYGPPSTRTAAPHYWVGTLTTTTRMTSKEVGSPANRKRATATQPNATRVKNATATQPNATRKEGECASTQRDEKEDGECDPTQSDDETKEYDPAQR